MTLTLCPKLRTRAVTGFKERNPGATFKWTQRLKRQGNTWYGEFIASGEGYRSREMRVRIYPALHDADSSGIRWTPR